MSDELGEISIQIEITISPGALGVVYSGHCYRI